MNSSLYRKAGKGKGLFFLNSDHIQVGVSFPVVRCRKRTKPCYWEGVSKYRLHVHPFSFFSPSSLFLFQLLYALKTRNNQNFRVDVINYLYLQRTATRTMFNNFLSNFKEHLKLQCYNVIWTEKLKVVMCKEVSFIKSSMSLRGERLLVSRITWKMYRNKSMHVQTTYITTWFIIWFTRVKKKKKKHI